MSLDERIMWFLLGVLVGLLIGWLKDIRRGEQEIKEELDEVVTIVKKQEHRNDESGFVRFPLVADFILLVVIAITVWASFSTAKTNSELERQGKRVEEITACNQQYLYKTIEALNERTKYSQTTADSNVELQKELAAFVDILLFQPPKSEAERYEALQIFDAKLSSFVINSSKQKLKTEAYPYPTQAELSKCLGYEVNTTKEKEQ